MFGEGQMRDGIEAGREALRFCNSYNRLPALIDLWDSLSLEWREWLQLLGEEWSSCDNIAQFSEHLLTETPFGELFDTDVDRRPLMTAGEWDLYQSLPDEVIVYRGCFAANKWGLSWSLDRDIAAGIVTTHRYRQGGQALLVKARASKQLHIAAVKLDRNEAEIIAHRPRHISTSHIGG